jgi:hypothetical protein
MGAGLSIDEAVLDVDVEPGEAGTARKRLAVMLPSESQVPTDVWPALRARLTELGRMRNSDEK